jgi:hypothetical protein
MARPKLNPTLLIVSSSRWFPIARLAIAFSQAGCRVEAVCSARDPLAKTGVVEYLHPYSGVAPLRSLRNAIVAAQPDFLVPGDDLSVQHLHSLFASEKSRGLAGIAICDLIERSFGAAGSFSSISDRAEFIRMAKEEGVRVPENGLLRTVEELRAWFTRMGFPAVLKINGTTGGEGVRVVRSLGEAEETFEALSAPPLLARAAKRLLVKRDRSMLWRSVTRRRSVVNVQSFISGREATSAVACWQGRVLAGVHFEVLHKAHAFGPATVIRRIEHPEMIQAAEKIVRRLHLSGLHGLDYMIENGTEKAYLIEINPRATQVGHLSFGRSHDLPAALLAAVTGQAVAAEKMSTVNDTVALFPQEWMRDPRSPWLSSAHHDVPWEAPELLRACLRRRPKRINWFSQAPRNEQNAPLVNSRPSPVVQLAKSNRDLEF